MQTKSKIYYIRSLFRVSEHQKTEFGDVELTLMLLKKLMKGKVNLFWLLLVL